MKQNTIRVEFIGRKKEIKQTSTYTPLNYRINQSVYANSLEEATDKIEEKYYIEEILNP